MLELSPGLMIVVLLIFFFLLYQLNDRLYKPLIRFMDERDRTIAADLEAAKNLSSDSDDLLKKAQENLDAARAEAARLRQEAIDAAKAETEKALTEKTAELEKEYEAFKARLGEEEKALSAAVLSEIPLIKEALKAKFTQL
ncbi:F0F1 ATP synthase subunit B family protein [Nitratifractor sp.]